MKLKIDIKFRPKHLFKVCKQSRAMILKKLKTALNNFDSTTSLHLKKQGWITLFRSIQIQLPELARRQMNGNKISATSFLPGGSVKGVLNFYQSAK